MLKSQLRHAYCVLLIWLCFVQASSVKVVSHSHPVHIDHIVSVDRSGSKAVSINNSALAAHSLSNRVEASTRFRKYGSAFNSDKVLVLITALAIWVVVAVACLAAPWTGASDDVKSPRSPRGEKATTISRKDSVMSSYNVMDTKSQVGVGSFAVRYQQSTGVDKQALELLRRCSVISQEEFYSDSVSLEHIEECIWVAKVMLLQKPLDVWVSFGQEGGQKSFQETVAAINSAREKVREGGEEDVAHPPESYVPQNCSPDSPQRNNESMLSPTSIQHSHVSAVSLGSSVSFGVEDPERQSGSGSPPKAGSAPPIDLPVPARNVPLTIAPVPPQSTAPSNKSPVPVLNCYNHEVDKIPALEAPLMDSEWTQLQNTNPLPERFPARRFSKAEDAAPPSSNEAMNSEMHTEQSLGGEGGGFLSVFSRPSGLPPATQETNYLLTPPSSGLAAQASQERTHRLIPHPDGLPLTSPAGTPTYPTSPPKEKLFSFKPQEVMAAPPEPSSAEEERALRLSSSIATLPVSQRGGLPDGAVRRLSSASDLTPLAGHRSSV